MIAGAVLVTAAAIAVYFALPAGPISPRPPQAAPVRSPRDAPDQPATR